MNTVEAIRQSLGRGLSTDEVEKIGGLAYEKTFMPGDLIVRQFDKNSDLLILLNGRTQIRTFREELVCELAAGSIIGEISLVDEQPRSANVRAVEPTTVAVIPAPKFRTLLDENPSMASTVYRNIAQTLCARLRVATIHMDGLMGRETVTR